MLAIFGFFVIGVIAVLGTYLIKTKDLLPSGRALYIGTLFFEVPCIATRALLSALLGPALLTPIWLMLFVLGVALYAITRSWVIWAAFLPTAGIVLAGFVLFCAFSPVLSSFASVLGFPSGQWFTKWVMGARTMSKREEDEYMRSLTIINRTRVKAPSHVFVTRWLTPRAMVIGTTLYIAKPLLHEPTVKYLPAVLAHELAYINTADGRLVTALRRLVAPPLYLLSWAMGQVAPGNTLLGGAVGAWLMTGALSLAAGGLGSFLLTPLWASYWQESQFRADAFAVALGQRALLIEYLEKYAYLDIAAPYLFPPYADTEMRIDKII